MGQNKRIIDEAERLTNNYILSGDLVIIYFHSEVELVGDRVCYFDGITLIEDYFDYHRFPLYFWGKRSVDLFFNKHRDRGIRITSDECASANMLFKIGEDINRQTGYRPWEKMKKDPFYYIAASCPFHKHINEVLDRMCISHENTVVTS